MPDREVHTKPAIQAARSATGGDPASGDLKSQGDRDRSPASIGARLDRLPSSRVLWGLVSLIALGGVFENYDLFFTAYVGPGMIKEGLFAPQSLGALGDLRFVAGSGFGTFIFATFAGLWIGVSFFSFIADRVGRRRVFTWALIWYVTCSAIMAFQNSGFDIDVWRFLAGIGLGLEQVLIGTFITELVPARYRGRAFAWQQSISYAVVPVVAFAAWRIVPLTVFGLDGWRIVVLIGSVGAIAIWFMRRGIPESPRWLARNPARFAEADRIVTKMEEASERAVGRPLDVPRLIAVEAETAGRLGEIFGRPLFRRTVVMSLFSFLLTIAYYGFSAWVPTLLVHRGILLTKSLEFSFIIAISDLFGPLLGVLFADKIERKWQIAITALGMGVTIAAFGVLDNVVALTLSGVVFILLGNIQSYAYHCYQAELFPTRVRSRYRLLLLLEPGLGCLFRPAGRLAACQSSRVCGLWPHLLMCRAGDIADLLLRASDERARSRRHQSLMRP